MARGRGTGLVARGIGTGARRMVRGRTGTARVLPPPGALAPCILCLLRTSSLRDERIALFELS